MAIMVDHTARIQEFTKTTISDAVNDRFTILERKTDKKIEKIHQTFLSNEEFKEYQKTILPVIEWYEGSRVKVDFLCDTLFNFYTSIALNPIVRLLNYFFHWYVLEICRLKYEDIEFCVVVRPYIMTDDNCSSSYKTRSNMRKSFYKKHMNIFKRHCKKIKKLGYSLKELPIKF